MKSSNKIYPDYKSKKKVILPRVDPHSLLHPEFHSRIERVNYIEFWDSMKNTHTDFLKVLIILNKYSSEGGVHYAKVREVIKDYFDGGFLKPIPNKKLLKYSIEYLLLELSAKLYFPQLNPDSGLVAILQMIQTYTNINPYDFGYVGREDMSRIRTMSLSFESWIAVCKWGGDEDIKLISVLFESKLIDMVDIWNVIVGESVLERDTQKIGERINSFKKYTIFSKEDTLRLFLLSKVQNMHRFTLYLYCKYYDLSIDKVALSYAGSCPRQIIESLSQLSGDQPIDGVLLLERVKKVHATLWRHDMKLSDQFKAMQSFSRMFSTLIERRHLIKNWKEIEKVLMNNNNVKYNDLSFAAKSLKSKTVINYLSELSAFTFFKGRYDGGSRIAILPENVVNTITEISMKKNQ
jgi:hypothetical protein